MWSTEETETKISERNEGLGACREGMLRRAKWSTYSLYAFFCQTYAERQEGWEKSTVKQLHVWGNVATITGSWDMENIVILYSVSLLHLHTHTRIHTHLKQRAQRLCPSVLQMRQKIKNTCMDTNTVCSCCLINLCHHVYNVTQELKSTIYHNVTHGKNFVQSLAL